MIKDFLYGIRKTANSTQLCGAARHPVWARYIYSHQSFSCSVVCSFQSCSQSVIQLLGHSVIGQFRPSVVRFSQSVIRYVCWLVGLLIVRLTVDQSVSQSVSLSVLRSVIQPDSRLVIQSVRETLSQSVSWSISCSVSQSVSQ